MQKGARQELAYLEIEVSRISREKAQNVLNKGFTLYFTFLAAGIAGFLADYFTPLVLDVFIICGFLILIISALPYLSAVAEEERIIKRRRGELSR